ncbi:uncharacterized protein BDV14DRAFT_182662 [Aspergillus stella-maris]|uniref:uncharacterized protein n=1 Tax=Aspergillus stella-maris TaxID=1810926 RepID=UPI003CCD4C73
MRYFKAVALVLSITFTSVSAIPGDADTNVDIHQTTNLPDQWVSYDLEKGTDLDLATFSNGKYTTHRLVSRTPAKVCESDRDSMCATIDSLGAAVQLATQLATNITRQSDLRTAAISKGKQMMASGGITTLLAPTAIQLLSRTRLAARFSNSSRKRTNTIYVELLA